MPVEPDRFICPVGLVWFGRYCGKTRENCTAAIFFLTVDYKRSAEKLLYQIGLVLTLSTFLLLSFLFDPPYALFALPFVIYAQIPYQGINHPFSFSYLLACFAPPRNPAEREINVATELLP